MDWVDDTRTARLGYDRWGRLSSATLGYLGFDLIHYTNNDQPA